MASGNLSFLNWLTAVPAVFSFDDLHLAGLFHPRVVRRLVRHLEGTSSPGGGGGGAGKRGGAGEQAAANVPAPFGGRRPEPGFGGEEGEGAGEGGGGAVCGSINGGGGGEGESSHVSGSGSGPGSRRPSLLRAQSTLQWSSESEDEQEEASGAPNKDDHATVAKGGDDDGGGPMPCAVVTAVLADDGGDSSSNSSYGRPRDSFGGILRFRGRGGKISSEKRSPAASGGGDGGVGGGGGAGATVAAGAAERLAGGAVRGGEQGRTSRVREKKSSLAVAGSVLRCVGRVLRWTADGLLVVLVLKGSIPVVKNMAGVGGGQQMNRNFDRCVLPPLSRRRIPSVSMVPRVFACTHQPPAFRIHARKVSQG